MKKYLKKLLVVMMSIVMTISLTSCGEIKDDKFYSESDPIQIVDGAGRNVSFEKPAETVATNWGGTVDPYLFALGLSDSIVAQNSKKRGLIAAMLPNYDNIPSVGSWSLDKEALADISPDVYIHSVEAADALKGANKVGVRSIGIKTDGYEDIIFNITMLGKVFGVEDRASELVVYYEGIINMVQDRVKDIPESERKTVVILGGDEGTVCKTSFEIELAGGINCADALEGGTERWPVAGQEKILSWNPDFIFAQNCYSSMAKDVIMNDSSWSGANAVKNGHVYDIPCPFESWININMSDSLAILYMSMQMYPELYEDVDFDQIVVDYYAFVYGLDITIEELYAPVD